MVWWRSVDLDYLHVVLSTVAARRILVRSRAELETIGSVAGRNACCRVGLDSFLPSNHSLGCLEADCGPITIFADSTATSSDRGRPLLHTLDDGAVAAALVQLHFASRVSVPFVRALKRRFAIGSTELSAGF